MKWSGFLMKSSWLVVSFLTLNAAVKEDTIQRYASYLQASLSAIEKRESRKELERHVKPMFDLSKDILKEYRMKHQDCAEYLDKTLAAADSMLKMSVDKIEKDYHADGALPKAPNHCYQVKDLLVHPATVLVLLSREGEDVYKQMHSELAELDAHLRMVKLKLEQEPTTERKE